MDIVIRPMEPDEASKVQRIGRRAFTGLERLTVSKPRQAVVAVKHGRIAGAVQYKLYRAGGKKIGYFDYAFVDPDFQNQGIGGALYKGAADFLLEQGCDALTALVKDDNVGSWGLFLKNGFTRISLSGLARQLGLAGMLRLYAGTIYSVAIGMDYYVSLREGECPAGKGGNTGQLAAYLAANLLLFLVMLLRGAESVGAFLAAYLIFVAGGVLAGYAGTLPAKRRWRFRLCNGGGLICAFVNFVGGVYPMIGNWYPERYENTAQFRRDMGIQALAGWAYVLLLTLLPVLAGGQGPLFGYLGQIGCMLLLYRILAFYPFESFGGGRVRRWSRWVYLLMAVASAAVCALQLLR